MEALATLSELEMKLQEAARLRSVSDDAFRQALSGWYLSPEVFGAIPEDELGLEFRRFQLSIYETLAGKVYHVQNEETAFDADRELRNPYPYSTASAQTVGSALMSYGWLIKSMDLGPGSRVLEVGSGYGALTVHLVGMGYHVTCLDISSALLEFVVARTAHLPGQIHTICGDMATVDIEDTFDAVVFSASLHHSLEHRAVVQRLDSILDRDGIVAFVDEPVVADDCAYVPYPWGVRLDGLSIWSIAEWGWLELGFRRSYFLTLLGDAGWELTRHNPGIAGSADIWLGARIGRERATSSAEPALREHVIDLEAEVARLRKLVEAYESGRFIRLMKWLHRHLRRSA